MFSEATLATSALDNSQAPEAMADDAASVASKRDAEALEEEVVIREPVDYRTLTELDKVTLKARSWKKTPFLAVKYDGLKPFMNITPDDDEWLRLPFGLRWSNWKDLERLTATIELSEGFLTFVSKFEEKIKEEALKLHPQKAWKSSLYNDLLDADVGLGDPKDSENPGNETLFMVKVPGKDAVEGSKKAFLKTLMDKNFDFQNATVKVVLSVQKLWLQEAKMGLNWKVTSMMVQVAPKVKTTWPTGFKASLFKK